MSKGRSSSDKNGNRINLVVDGVDVCVPEGTTVLDAAMRAGTEVPHYCYHPGLSSPAQCRLCLVEIEGAPKLMPSCTTTVAEGQVVHTASDSAKKMRQGVLEFYLINHPLDCPICDQSGECDLQDFVFAEGRQHGRSTIAKRVIGRDDFGGDVLFYGDRCVMCTRCVRFMEEMEEKPLLTVVERGNRAVIDTFFERGLEEANWAGNVVDICPVGALVSKDFLHKARAWDLEHTPSVCPNCSMGCNIEIHSRDNLVQRFKPRSNPEVNGYWLCDYGRGRYEWLNEEGRLERPSSANESKNPKTEDEWEVVLQELGGRLKECTGSVKAVLSPLCSNEDIGATLNLLKAIGGGDVVFRCPMKEEELPLPGEKGLRRTRYLAPNVDGLVALGAVNVGNEEGFEGLDQVSQDTEVLIVVGDRLLDQEGGFASEVDLVVYLGSHPCRALEGADFLLPITTLVEKDGTFVNCDGRLQRFSKALEGPPESRPAWAVLDDLTAILRGSESYKSTEDAFNGLGKICESFSGVTYADIGSEGIQLEFEPSSVEG